MSPSRDGAKTPTRDDSGSYIFLRDTRSGVVWSAGFQPTGVEPDEYAVDFNEDRVEIARRDGTLTTTLEVLVSAEDDAEVRRVSISNTGGRARDIEITSYNELALGPQGADVAHPAFAKLFVETEYLEDFGAILATRRRRSPSEPEIWAAHLSVAIGESVGRPEFETDRARFLGRGQGVSAPIAMLDARPLTNSIGAVLDPIFALRRRVRVAAGATVRVAFWTMAAGTRAALLDCVDKHRDAAAYERATTLAWTQAQVQLHHLDVNPGEAGLFQRLASHVIFAGRDLRPSSDVIRQGSGPQSGLWSQGISGDLPIVLLRIVEIESLNVARQLLQAHEYWRMKQLAVDLVILNERKSSYVQDLQVAIETLVRASQSRPTPGIDHRPGRVFVLRADLIDPDTRSLLVSTARIVLVAQHGSLSVDLASEARLASFFAIAKGDIPARHWFRLGRAGTPVTHGTALISWSGSMFEYLMPPLVMRAPARSLLEQTDRLVVRRQIEYGEELGLPWGISESAYNARDLELTYQYSNFGVPGLGLKRGLGENRVIAPYATGLATMVDPSAAAANFKRLATLGAGGRYGFYEAVDFTPTRVPEGERFALVRAFMAHHQGMTIAGIANAVFDGAMRERFHAEPIIQATELLLQERVPREVASTRPWAAEVKSGARASDADPSGGRRIVSVHQSTPATQLLSNGNYAVMMTAAGSGYSRWGDVAITRWREDATRDDSGSYIFLRDTRSGAVWSAGFQPTGVEPDEYAVDFNEDRVEIARRDGTLTTTLEVLVSAEDDAEVRRVSISNAGGRARDIEITSYTELALGPQGADVAHPAFAKLFVETEYLEDFGAILATRRKRTPSEPELWAAHVSVANGEAVGRPEFETDRARFLGRGQGVSAPIAVMDARPLTNSVGAVLDPIFALRRRVRVAAGATVRVAFWTMAAGTRATLLDCVDKHRDAAAYERATTLAWTQAQVQLHHLGVNPGEAGLFQRLASHVIFAGPDLRPSSDVIRQGSGPQSGLWSQGHLRRSSDRAVANRRDREHSMSPARSCKLTNIGG